MVYAPDQTHRSKAHTLSQNNIQIILVLSTDPCVYTRLQEPVWEEVNFKTDPSGAKLAVTWDDTITFQINSHGFPTVRTFG